MMRGYSKSYIFEILFAVGVLMAANIIWWPEYPAFDGISPHPYWMIVLPMAVYYGFREGTAAAAACAAVYLCWTWFFAEDKYWLIFLSFDRLKTPIGFIAVGMMIGELRERRRRIEIQQREKIEELENALQDISVKNISLTEAKRELEVRILSQDQTVQTLYRAAEGLSELEEEHVYPAVLDILVNYLSVTAASVYLLKEDKFIRHSVKGKVEPEFIPEELSSREGLMGGALSNRSLATIRMILTTENIGIYKNNSILVSAPIILEGGAVVGMVNVHKLPFLRFTPATVRMVGLLSDWAGIAIANARQHKEVSDKNINDELTGAYTPEYLQKRLKEEFSRAKRYGMGLSLLMAVINDYEQIDELEKRDVLTVIGNLFRGAIRDSDMLFRYKGENIFILLLPATALSGCQIVGTKMIREIDAFKLKPYKNSNRQLTITVSYSEFLPDMKDYSEMLEMAEKDLEI